jgi:hypothetical protein
MNDAARALHLDYSEYLALESVLVSQAARRIEVFRRNADGTWTYGDAGAGGRMRLESIDAELSVDEVYGEPVTVTPQAR